MRTATVAAIASLALVAPPAARAGFTLPTSREDHDARVVAANYWGGQPACGAPTVQFTRLPDGTNGQADLASCAIEITTQATWTDDPVSYCNAMVHEFGHLVLGPNYFAAANPADPAHAPTGTTGGLAVMVAKDGTAPMCHSMADMDSYATAARPARHRGHRHVRRHRRHRQRP